MQQNKDKPLLNKKILITRAKEQAREFSQLINKFGGIPLECPLIEIQPPKDEETIKDVLTSLDTYQWLVFTSVNGVNYFFTYLDKYANDRNRALQHMRIAAVGSKTKKALEQKGVFVDLIPPTFEATFLYQSLSEKLATGDKILLARGNLAKKDIVNNLNQNGYQTTDLIVYETVRNEKSKETLLNILIEQDLNMITFTSPSTVDVFVSFVNEQDMTNAIENVAIACIGTVTANAAKKHNLPVDIVANEFTIDDMVTEIIHYYRNSKK